MTRHATGNALHRQARDMARPAGLEPATYGLEGRCSIRLSYRRILQNRTLHHNPLFEKNFFSNKLLWSGWRDSNPRHPAPKAGALPDCATPRRPAARPCKPPKQSLQALRILRNFPAKSTDYRDIPVVIRAQALPGWRSVRKSVAANFIQHTHF